MTPLQKTILLDALNTALLDFTGPEGWHPPGSECGGCPTCKDTIPMLELAIEVVTGLPDTINVPADAAPKGAV